MTSEIAISIDFLNIIADLIYTGIDGKYSYVDREYVLSAVKEYTNELRVVSAHRLLSGIKCVKNPQDDILNQFSTVCLIEFFWRDDIPKNPISTIHKVISGGTGELEIRKESYVSDFGGGPPVSIEDINGAMNELELLVERFTPVFKSKSDEHQAKFLAHVLSSIIRIHPFGDGNGRTSRMVIQLCMRTWDKPFLQIPKVRNDARWATAMTYAVTGGILDDLEAELVRRMLQA